MTRFARYRQSARGQAVSRTYRRSAAGKASSARNQLKNGRRYRLKHRFGLTEQDYERILAAQDGHCALCPRTPSVELHSTLCVDHYETTIRGLLCRNCNVALGKLGDNAAGLRRALAYVEGARG